MVVKNCNKFCINSLREEFIVFKHRANLFNVKIVNVIHKHNAVWVTHRYAGNVVFLVADCNRLVYNLVLIHSNRDFLWIKNCLAHIYSKACYLTVGCVSLKALDT